MGRHAHEGLTAQDVSPQLAGHSGVPFAADAVAYDPVQRLVAVRRASCEDWH